MEKTKEIAELCFTILKKAGHFKDCDGAWEKNQIELAIINHSNHLTDQIKSLEEQVKELKESLRYANKLAEEERIDHANGLIHAESQLESLQKDLLDWVEEHSFYSDPNDGCILSCDTLIDKIKSTLPTEDNT